MYNNYRAGCVGHSSCDRLKGEGSMDRYTKFKLINDMLSQKHNYTFPFNEEARMLICRHDSEIMYKIMFSLYVTKNVGEEFVRESIAGVSKETKRTIGFDIQRG
jgi:hypothetical protein